MQAFRLLIVNNIQAVRSSWASLFSSRGGFLVVGEIDEINDFDFVQHLQPDVVLIGLKSYENKDMQIVSKIKEICPWTLVIIFSELEENSGILAALVAGADGYLKKPILPADLVTAIGLTCRSGICFFPRSAKEFLPKTIANISGG